MNQEKHWNNIADSYDDEVFDVFESDRSGTLQKYLKKHANLSHTATDFGCGIGKAFKFLAPCFKRVLARRRWSPGLGRSGRPQVRIRPGSR
jgi:hypothetical protein